MMKQETVLITGASRGIGKAIAHIFARNRYNLVLNCKSSIDKLTTLKSELEQNYSISCELCIGDVSDSSFVASMFQKASRAFGGVDILINNAGISHIGLLSEMTVEQWNRLLSTNLSSVFYCCRAALPHMIHIKKGSIINISSVWGESGASCETAYSASKGGMNSFTKALAKELAPSNIQVNAVACGAIETDMNAGLDKQEKDALLQEIPAGRLGLPEEAALLVYQLVHAPTYLTGQIITMDGGWM